MSQSVNTDVVIIGAGPVGLFTIFQCGMLGLKCHLVDALDVIGGQCAVLYPEKPIYDIPSHPVILGQELVNHLKDQAQPFNPEYHLGHQAVSFTKNETGYTVKTHQGLEISCKAIIIAAGGGAFGPNRPPLERLEEYENKSVFYFVKSREAFKNKRIVIAGGGDSALDWTLSLAELSQKIYLVHRRDKFRAAPESLNKLQSWVEKDKVELVVPYQLKGLEGQDGQLRAVNVSTLKGDEKSLEADNLLLFFGLAMDLGPLSHWDVALEKNHILVSPETMQTNLPGIFGIGDIVTYPGKLKLILTGFSEAAIAAHAIYNYINPDKVLHFEYSTTKGVPGAGIA